jgi:hypothetical protein
MMLTPGPWRASDRDACEIWTHDGRAFIAAIASPRNAPAIAAIPTLLGLVFELAELRCACGDAGPCAPCRAQHLLAAFESDPNDEGA